MLEKVVEGLLQVIDGEGGRDLGHVGADELGLDIFFGCV